MQINNLFRHYVPSSALLVLTIVLATVGGPVPVPADENASDLVDNLGQQIYQAQCAACHGQNGEGTQTEYPSPLVGDWPLQKLIEVIETTMPEGEADACVAEDAVAVARYVYDAFYSPTAQLRNAPPRVELSRLTAAQFQQSVADLGSHFLGATTLPGQRGLQTEFFAAKHFDRKQRKIERIEPRVVFDFGNGSPMEELEAGKAFSILMTGGLIVPETGRYQFTIQTPNAAKLFLNDQVLIDAKIKSGDQDEYTATTFLLGGRIYPVRLEYFRGEVGTKKVGAVGQPTASLRLLWQRPGRSPEAIPTRNLSPKWAPRIWTVTTPFPPDDSSVGYARGITVSQAWIQATTNAALELGSFIAEDLDRLAKTKRDDSDREKKVREFCERLVANAIRQPLSDQQRAQMVDRHFQTTDSLEQAVRRIVLVALKSPHFLYPETASMSDDPSARQMKVANRLALCLWDSLPDSNLLSAAEQGKLSDPGTLRWQAERMVKELPTRGKLADFFLHWLHVDHVGEVSKDQQLFPDFSPELVSDLRESLEVHLETLVWEGEGSDFRQLLTDHQVYASRRMTEFYGWESSSEADYQWIARPQDQTAGVLTHPLILAGLSYSHVTSPIHRGVFLARSVLGRNLRPPPIAVSPLSPDLHADLTNRQRIELQTRAPACNACHELINPLGFALEHFDTVGRYRTTEAGAPIDASGQYMATDGSLIAFSGVEDLSRFLVNSDDVHRSFVGHLFEHMTKQPIAAYGTDQLSAMTQVFQQSNFDIRKLLADIAVFYAQTEPTKYDADRK